jgi:hypothetical protein
MLRKQNFADNGCPQTMCDSMHHTGIPRSGAVPDLALRLCHGVVNVRSDTIGEERLA